MNRKVGAARPDRGMERADMTTLVIGGGGFVGLNIVEDLLGRGRDVVLFDVAPPPLAALRAFEGLPGTLRVVAGDVTQPGSVAGAMDPGVDTMIYGAAVTAGLDRDRSDPELTMAVNLDGFLGALRVARDAGLGRVINLSSAGAYGAAAFRGAGPLAEDDPAPDPQSIYSITKFASERIGARMAEVWGLDVINVRLSAVFGRWERRTGVRDTPSPQFQILEALTAGRTALVERLDDRDWIHAPDVANAVTSLLDAKSLQHRLYNISTGQTFSVLSWGERMAAHFPNGSCRLAEPGEPANVLLHAPQDRRPLAIDRLRADTSFKTCQELGQTVDQYLEWARSIGSVYN